MAGVSCLLDQVVAGIGNIQDPFVPFEIVPIEVQAQSCVQYGSLLPLTIILGCFSRSR